MKFHKLILLLNVFFGINSFAQTEVDNGKISMDLYVIKKVSVIGNLTSTTRLKSEEYTKIILKCKVQVKNGLFDFNKLSLVDRNNKLRYKAIEVHTKRFIDGLQQPILLVKRDISKDDKKGRFPLNIEYDPNIIDHFDKFSIAGFENIEIPMNFGSKNDPIISNYYFKPTTIKKFKNYIYFSILTISEKSNLELYYGNEKIDDVILYNNSSTSLAIDNTETTED